MPYNIEGISIRPLRDDELWMPDMLARRIWPETYAEILPPDQVDYMIKLMYALPVVERERRDGIVYELICDAKLPIGFLSYGLHGQTPPTLKLHKIYLEFAYHDRGIGSMALQHVIAAARKMGCSRLCLNVNKRNTAALRAYERNGFRKAGAVKLDIGGGYFMDDYVMELAL